MRVSTFQSTIKSAIMLAEFEIEPHVLSLDELLLLLGVNVQIGVALLQPGVLQGFYCRKALVRVHSEETSDQVLHLFGE